MKNLFFCVLSLVVIICNAAGTSEPFYNNSENIGRYARQANDGSCAMPENPRHGRYQINSEDSRQFEAGESVSQYAVLFLICDPSYKTTALASNSSICFDGSWSPELLTCHTTCESLTSTESTKISCSFENVNLKTCNDPVDQTIATIKCQPYYENPSIEGSFSTVCKEGKWNETIPECVPICGEKRPLGRTNIINGTNVIKGDYPWHVAIYTSEEECVCSGSIISQKLILTAAHCLTNHVNGKLEPKEYHRVAVGKYYRSYYDPRDQNAQYPIIENIYIPDTYRSSRLQFEYDIAVVVVKQLFFSNVVQPICVDWSGEFELEQLIPNNIGVITGWGYTNSAWNDGNEREGSVSDELKELAVPYIPLEQCFRGVLRNFTRYLRPDKLCAGYLNQGASICAGDGGGPLAFPRLSNGKYYIRGIALFSPTTSEGDCISNQYHFYTSISKYLSFIRSVMINNNASITTSTTLPMLPATSTMIHGSDVCLTPSQPTNSVYLFGNATETNYNPPKYIPQFTSLRIQCESGYAVRPHGTKLSICDNGQWQPTPEACSRTCMSLKSSKTTKIQCKHGNVPMKSCRNPVEGTIAEISCKPMYEEPSLHYNPTRLCRSGEWSSEIHRCFPRCGEKRADGRPNIINGTHVKKGDYPWHAGVYTSKKKHICGASIIKTNMLLSAAHCFTNDEGRIQASDKYLIAAGKYYRSYEDLRDTQAQYSKVQSIHVPEIYRGTITNYEADISVIILETPFKLSETLKPVCLDLNDEFEFQQLVPNNYGVVTGWGYTEEGKAPSEELKELSLPFIPYQQCFDEVPKVFQRFITSDKICAGFLGKGTAVCGGDSGGAISFERDNDRYYVRGVVSTSPANDLFVCDSNQYGTYTSVSKHLHFIKDLITLNGI